MTEGGASTAGTLQGYLVVGHCRGHLVVGHYRDTWWLGTAGTLGGWALQGHLLVGHCSGWALQGHLVVGHCRDTWWLGTAGTLGGWARKSACSPANTTSSLKSNNPTVRVGKSSVIYHEARSTPIVLSNKRNSYRDHSFL